MWINAVRAGIAETPKTSDYTSIQARLLAYAEQLQRSSNGIQVADQSSEEKRLNETASAEPGYGCVPNVHSEPPAALLPFRGGEHVDVNPPLAGIPFAFSDYLALADWTGRATCDDKRGVIPEDVPPIPAASRH